MSDAKKKICMVASAERQKTYDAIFQRAFDDYEICGVSDPSPDWFDTFSRFVDESADVVFIEEDSIDQHARDDMREGILNWLKATKQHEVIPLNIILKAAQVGLKHEQFEAEAQQLGIYAILHNSTALEILQLIYNAQGNFDEASSQSSPALTLDTDDIDTYDTNMVDVVDECLSNGRFDDCYARIAAGGECKEDNCPIMGEKRATHAQKTKRPDRLQKAKWLTQEDTPTQPTRDAAKEQLPDESQATHAAEAETQATIAEELADKAPEPIEQAPQPQTTEQTQQAQEEVALVEVESAQPQESQDEETQQEVLPVCSVCGASTNLIEQNDGSSICESCFIKQAQGEGIKANSARDLSAFYKTEEVAKTHTDISAEVTKTETQIDPDAFAKAISGLLIDDLLAAIENGTITLPPVQSAPAPAPAAPSAHKSTKRRVLGILDVIKGIIISLIIMVVGSIIITMMMNPELTIWQTFDVFAEGLHNIVTFGNG